MSLKIAHTCSGSRTRRIKKKEKEELGVEKKYLGQVQRNH